MIIYIIATSPPNLKIFWFFEVIKNPPIDLECNKVSNFWLENIDFSFMFFHDND